MKRLALALIGLLAFASTAGAEVAVEYVSAYDPAYVARVASSEPFGLPQRMLRSISVLPMLDVGSSIRGGSGGASVSGTNTWTGTQTFIDNAFFVVDDGDNTKKIAFQASGITTGTTRTFTFPNVNATVFTGSSTNDLLAGGHIRASADATGLALGAVDSASNRVLFSTIQTPDSALLSTGTTSNAWVICETQDATFDFAHAAQTNPTWFVHSAAQSTTQWTSVTHDGTNGVLNTGTGNLEITPSMRAGGGAFFINSSNLDVFLGSSSQLTWQDSAAANSGNQVGMQHARVKTLTESSATTIVEVPVAASAGTGGRITYEVFAADATDQQSRAGSITFAVVNKAGTETCTLSGASEAADGSVIAASVGTLTYAITCSTAPTNAVDIQLNAVSSLTQTTLEARIHVLITGPGVPTFP